MDGKPAWEIVGSVPGPWTVILNHAVEPPRVYSETRSSKSEAKRLVAEQFLNANVPNWRVPRAPSKPCPAATERTADQALYEIAAAKGSDACTIVHPHIDDPNADHPFFLCSARYKTHVFEERERVAKDHSACKKSVALKIIKKLARAEHPLAIKFLEQLAPMHMIRGRLMPMEEGAEAEFKGAEDENDCLLQWSGHWGPKLKDVLRNVCAFLNTAGGSLWYGVHDSRIVQGMPLTSEARDRIELAVRGSINQHLEPLSWDYIAIRWHAVDDDGSKPLPASSDASSAAASSTAATAPSVKSKASPGPQKASASGAVSVAHSAKFKAAAPAAPSTADLAKAPASVAAYLTHLEEQRLHASRTADLCVLEISVLPSRIAHFWDGKAYYRNGNQTILMPIPMLKDQIRKEPVA